MVRTVGSCREVYQHGRRARRSGSDDMLKRVESRATDTVIDTDKGEHQ